MIPAVYYNTLTKNVSVKYMNLKPSFSASKVAAITGMNPFQPAFDELFQTMVQHGMPVCVLGSDSDPDVLMDDTDDLGSSSEEVQPVLGLPSPHSTRLLEKQALDQHLQQVVKPHITESTTIEDLQKLEKQLSVLGPLGPQAAQVARMRFGQVAEKSTVDFLRASGTYQEPRYMKGEFKHFYLSGKTDGLYNGKIVEIKNRKNKFLGITSYERPQFECYMRLFGEKELYLCETLKKESGLQQRLTLVHSNDELWSTLVQRLTWASQFMEEVCNRPFLQQLDEVLLETHYNQFLKECSTFNQGVDNLE